MDIPVSQVLHLRDLLSHYACFSEVDEMSKTDVVGTGRYKTLINQVMIQIEFFHDVRMHVVANSVMRTFSGEGLLNTLYFLHTGLSKEAWLRFLKGGIYFPTFQFERTFLLGIII